MFAILYSKRSLFTFMAQNKKSIWSVLILIATIISLVLLVTSVILMVVGIPAISEAAKQGAIEGGATQEEAGVIAGIAIGAVIVAFVFASVFDVLKIIGGFLFSLKGRWGIFCIIVSILSVASGIWTLVSDITNKAAAGSIVVAGLSLAVSALLCFACFKHCAEIRR